MTMNKALIVVDMQNDFITGSLAVPGASQIIQPIVNLINLFVDEWKSDPERSETMGVPIYYSLDWHSPDHPSFEPFGGTWPVHCVAGSVGAALTPHIPIVPGSKLILKGQNDECYSAMGGIIGASLTPHSAFSLRGIKYVEVVGLALDYCVRSTAVDAARLGYKVRVWRNHTAAVDQDMIAPNVLPTVNRIEQIFRREGIEFL